MLMERFDVDAAAAFDLLVTLSQKPNTPLATTAQKLVELTSSGRINPPDSDPGVGLER